MPFTSGQGPSICMVTWMIRQCSASHVLPVSQGWIKPGCEPELLLWWWILSWRLCSLLMDGTSKGCFLEERHQRAVKLLWEDSITRIRIAEEGRFLLGGNKVKCCFPVGSSSTIQSDINWRLSCKSYHACKLVTVVYSFLNNLRQFLSRVLW